MIIKPTDAETIATELVAWVAWAEESGVVDPEFASKFRKGWKELHPNTRRGIMARLERWRWEKRITTSQYCRIMRLLS